MPFAFASGVEAAHTAIYWKNQFGAVTLALDVQMTDGSVIGQTTLVGVLPVGYRPEYKIEIPVVFAVPNEIGRMYIPPNGNVEIYRIGTGTYTGLRAFPAHVTYLAS
jgi:hypothetical protein